MAIHQFDEREAARLDKQYAIPIIVEQRRHTLEALNALAGERILDVGSGPAFLTADIARLVGTSGRVCAVDASEAMLEVGRRRCAAFPQAEFQLGNALELPYPDASFDAAVAVQIYLYVAELDAALVELLRVLRPGGRAILMDTDWGSAVWHSSDPDRMARVLDVWKQRYANGLVARLLPGALSRAGFVVEGAKAVPIVELTATEEDYSGGQLREIARYVGRQPDAAGAEAAAWKDDLLALAASGEYFFSLNRYLIVARRPA